MIHTTKSKVFVAALILAVLAGVVYNSWPLGYLLNPLVTHSGGLASELEGLNQPYNWLFVSLDVVCGLCVMLAAGMLWHKSLDYIRKLTLVNFALFGLLTIADALLPMTCEPSLATCPTLSHQPILILHGIASIGSAIFLFVSATLMWHRLRRHGRKMIMTVMMLGWAISGVLTIYFFFVPGPGYLSQDYYLLLCGAWMALLPIMLSMLAYEEIEAGS